jgi:H/ACA ribonucleoprotein complex non-core subunit NAF1
MQHIIDLGVQVGMEVYFAPRTRHTAYVFVDALFQQKGSDASWENDQEPPEGCLDYSDDEQERRAKAAHRLKKNPRTNSEESTNPCKKRQANKPRRNKVQNYMQQQQAPVNPFYMVPPPGYSPCYPPPSINYTNVAPSIPPMPITSTTEQMIFPSPYVYPPPPTQAVDLAQNHLSQPVDLMQNHLSQPADSSPQNLPLQPGDPSQNPPTTSADPTQKQPSGL